MNFNKSSQSGRRGVQIQVGIRKSHVFTVFLVDFLKLLVGSLFSKVIMLGSMNFLILSTQPSVFSVM